MSFFLAVDAGGTKADLVLADETRVLARVRTGTIKRMRADAASAVANLDAGLDALVAKTGVSLQTLIRTCVGTAGETIPMVREWLREEFAARVGGELLIVGDVDIALDAAFPGGPGILVLAGTGSNVAGRTPSGELSTIGGWGPALGDEGSGYRIGHEALRAAFLARDEGRATMLIEAVMGLWGLASVEALVECANCLPAPDFSRLTELVLACAESGDAVAAEVLRRQGESLGHLVRVMIRRLQAGSDDPGWVPEIAFAGSIMECVTPVRTALLESVREEFPKIVELEGVFDPIGGALWRARRG